MTEWTEWGRNIKQLFRKALILLLLLWTVGAIGVTVAIGYKLWWTRDRVMYGSPESRSVQAAVLQNAGLNTKIADLAIMAVVTWPENAEYRAEGDPNSLSYVKYLLAPRVPAGGGNYTFRVSDDELEVTPGKETNPVKQQAKSASEMARFFVSVLLAGGIGYLFHLAACVRGMSIPEKFAAGMIVICVLTVIFKAVLETADPAFILCAVLGGAGLVMKVISVAQNALRCPTSISGGNTKTEVSVLCGLMVGVVAAAVAVSWLLSVAVGPDDWDAWAIWGPKAKVLALGDGSLKGVTYFGHADYPLLWPSLWAFSGWCAGGWEDVYAKGWGALLLGLTAWQMAVVVQRLGGNRWHGWFAAALFASVPKVVVVSSWAYAEAPLWLMGVCWFGRLMEMGYGRDYRPWTKDYRHQTEGIYLTPAPPGARVAECTEESGEDKRQWTIDYRPVLMSGIFAAGCALTKNEGVMFAVMGGIWILFMAKKMYKTKIHLTPASPEARDAEFTEEKRGWRYMFLRAAKDLIALLVGRRDMNYESREMHEIDREQRGWRFTLLRLANYAIPVVVLCGPWFVWTRLVLKLGDHATASAGMGIMKLLEHGADRVWPAAVRVVQIWMDWQQWGIVVPVVMLASLVVLVLGIWRAIANDEECLTPAPPGARAAEDAEQNRGRRCKFLRSAKDLIALTCGDRRVVWVVSLPLSILLVFFGIIVFHQAELYWQIGASWDRLTIQVLPMLILAVTTCRLNAKSKAGSCSPCKVQ